MLSPFFHMGSYSVNGAWWSLLKEKSARSGFENGFVQKPSLGSVLALGRGDTPLHEAAYYGKAEVVELLLEANAPVDVQNNGGRGPQFGHDSFGFY